MAVLAFVPDIMDQSKVGANGRSVRFVSEEELVQASEGDTLVVDLSRVQDMESIANSRARRIIAFGSHVDKTLMQRAEDAGATEIMPRSVFFVRINELLA